MKAAALRILAVCALILILLFLPYCPGEYDHLAVMVSSIIQVAAFVSAPLVPVGLLWFLHDRARRKKEQSGPGKTAGLAVAALVASGVAVGGASFAALGGIGSFRGSLLMGILLPVIFVCVTVFVVIPRIRKLKRFDGPKPAFAPCYLVLIPLIVLLIRGVFIGPAVQYSTDRAIAQCAVLIEDLEGYYAEHGRYPISLQGLWKDYSPGVMGIEKFYYEPGEKSYNLFFEQLPADLFAREIVLYNPQDEHVIRSHPSFIFSLAAEEFERYRGYFAAYDLSQRHWKSFLFD